MRRRVTPIGLAIAALVTALLAATTTSPATAAPGANAPSPNASANGRHAVRVCPEATRAAVASCASKVLVDSNGAVPRATNPPAGALTPTNVRQAYNLTSSASGGKTVAIVDAYGYPNLERDLATYRTKFGIPVCSTSSGCLRILDQNGGTSLPRFDTGWAGEQALDVDAVSATCPDCKIVVVQAKSASFADLGTAVNTAARQPGVVAISNSYGGGDLPDSTYGKPYFDHPGIAITASTGDDGYQGASFPASSSYVTAVGGTSLAPASNARGWNETAWTGAGSGCSTYNNAVAPTSFGTGCAKRAIADVSAAANPSQGGLAVYWPTNKSSSTWAQVGGTSESAPIIASVYAMSGNTSGYANAIPYANSAALYDVTSGSNGTCPTTQWCHARTSWDGPTGLGTPNGTGAF